MWLLLFIFITNGEFDKVEIREVHYGEKECKDRGNYAASLGIPEGLVLSCIQLKGVLKTNAKKLQ